MFIILNIKLHSVARNIYRLLSVCHSGIFSGTPACQQAGSGRKNIRNPG